MGIKVFGLDRSNRQLLSCNRGLGSKFKVEILNKVKKCKGLLILGCNKKAKVKILSCNQQQGQKLQEY